MKTCYKCGKTLSFLKDNVFEEKIDENTVVFCEDCHRDFCQDRSIEDKSEKESNIEPIVATSEQNSNHSWKCHYCGKMATQSPCEYCGDVAPKELQKAKIETNVPENEPNKKRIKAIVMIAVVIAVVSVSIYSGVSIYRQVVWADHINQSINQWISSVSKANLTGAEWERIEYEMEEYRAPNSLFQSIVKNRCGDNYEKYSLLYGSTHTLRSIQNCYNEYVNKENDSNYQISDETITDFQHINESVFERTDTYLLKYKEYYETIKPSEDNVHIVLVRSGIDNDENMFFRIENDNVFPIHYVGAKWDFTVHYVSEYSGFQTGKGSMPIAYREEIPGGETKKYEFTFDPDRYCPGYHSYFYWEIYNSDINSKTIRW